MLKSFLLGAAGYPLLEIVTRRRTHPSMALAGGLSAMALHRISHSRSCIAAKALAGGAAVTLIEGACGLIWNRRHRVWDYRRTPLNWRGQVCLPYTLLWTGIAACWMLIDRSSGAQPSHAPRGGRQPSHQP